MKMPVTNSPRTTPTPLASTDSKCAICNQLMYNTHPCYSLACLHVFHKLCLENWMVSHSCCYSCNVAIQPNDPKLVVGNCSPPRAQPIAPTAQNTTRVMTRNLTKALEQVQGPSTSQDQEPRSLNQSAAASSVLDVSNSPTQAAPVRSTRGRQRGRSYRPPPAHRNNEFDYTIIQNMIEETVTRLMSSLNTQTNPLHVQAQSVPVRETPSPVTSSLFTRKTADIMQKWNLHFDGSPEGLGVEEFIYRVKSLTDETLDSDFTAMCKHMHVLFAGKARDWYWRYHKQVNRIVWSDFCSALRQHYKDYRSAFMSMELIRSRKQKFGEPFSAFYESVASLIDKSSIKIAEEELVEILKNNLLPDTRQKLLYQPVHSVGHLRRLVQMNENLAYELNCRAEQVRKSKPFTPQRQIHALEESCAEPEEEDVQHDLELAALRNAHEKLTCWNCDELGHIWENCLASRRIFCYGCGKPNVYKPQCKNCLQKLSENRRQGASNNTRMPPKP